MEYSLFDFFIISSIEPVLLFIYFEDFLVLAALLLLIFLSGLFSGSEVAYMSLSPSDLENLEESSSESAKTVLNLRHHSKKFIALILVCNTFVNIAIALLLERLLSAKIPLDSYSNFSTWFIDLFNIESLSVVQINTFINFLIAVLGSTFILILFGETMPKIYGQLKNVSLALKMAIPLQFLGIVFYPLIYPLVTLSTLVERRLLERRLNTSSSAKKDLDAAIDLAVSDDLSSAGQVEMLKGIIKFNDVAVSQVMTTRTDVCGIDLTSNFNEVVKCVKENAYSRFPVFVDDFDKIAGILYSKDLISHLNKPDNFDWQALVRSNLLYVPETRKIHDLLNDFQVKKVHMAIVVDEYGGTSGIVTLEDIMEEIVGEIKDEFDDHYDLNFSKIDSHNYIFDGKTLINDMCRVLSVDIFEFDGIRGPADSIAGLILEQTGEMPKKDHELTLVNLKFKIISVNKKRIEKIQVTLI